MVEGFPSDMTMHALEAASGCVSITGMAGPASHVALALPRTNIIGDPI